MPDTKSFPRASVRPARFTAWVGGNPLTRLASTVNRNSRCLIEALVRLYESLPQVGHDMLPLSFVGALAGRSADRHVLGQTRVSAQWSPMDRHVGRSLRRSIVIRHGFGTGDRPIDTCWGKPACCSMFAHGSTHVEATLAVAHVGRCMMGEGEPRRYGVSAECSRM